MRHGAAETDGLPRYWGHTDLPLSPQGAGQARQIAERLAGEPIAAVYSSDLRRCLASAEIIAAPHNLSVTPCRELREIDFGDCEGQTFAEIDERSGQAARFWEASAACFPGGESTDLLAQRVERFLARLADHAPTDRVLVVSHGGPLSLLICRLLGLAASRWWQLRVDLASLSIVDVYAEGSVLALLNDLCHLAGR